jgi:hypothetical protein
MFKALAVHISTLVLVGQFASAIHMPPKERAFLVLAAAIYPSWTIAVFLLRFLANLGVLIIQPWQRRRIRLVACRAIGMYAEAQIDEQYELSAGSSGSIPQAIPLAEASCYGFPDIFQPQRPGFLQWLRRGVSQREPGKSLRCTGTVFLACVYLVQAVITAHLVFRRAGQDVSIFEASGIPLVTDTRGRWEKGSYSGESTSMAPMLTPLDSQAYQLSILGIVMGFSYISLQLLPIRWTYADADNLRWTYNGSKLLASLTRSAVGLGTSWLFDFVFRAYSGFQRRFYAATGHSSGTTNIRFLATLLQPAVEPAEEFFLLFSVLLIALLIALAMLEVFLRLDLHRSRWSSRIWRATRFVSQLILRLLLSFFRTFDFDRQFPSLQHFGDDSYGVTEGSLVNRWIYIGMYFAFSLFILIPQTRSLIETLAAKQRTLISPVATQSGCVYTSEVYAWTWKDPLADRLWAF